MANDEGLPTIAFGEIYLDPPKGNDRILLLQYFDTEQHPLLTQPLHLTNSNRQPFLLRAAKAIHMEGKPAAVLQKLKGEGVRIRFPFTRDP